MPRSPCTRVCTIDRPSGWCVGCGRTLEEIAGWGRFGALRRRWVMARLGRRLRRLGRRLRRLARRTPAG